MILSGLRPLFVLAQRYFFVRGTFSLSCALVAWVAISDLICPWLVMLSIDTIVDPDTMQASRAPGAFVTVLELVALMGAVVFAQYGVRYVLGRLHNRAVFSGSSRLREDLFARIQSQALNFHNERRMGEVLTHLIADIQILQDATLEILAEAPYDFLIMLGLAVAMFMMNVYLALAVSLFLLLMISIAVAMGRRGWHKQASIMQNTSEMTSRVQESLQSIKTLQMFGAASGEQSQVDALSRQYAQKMEEAGEIRATVTPFFGLSEYAGIILVLLLGGWSVLHGMLTTGGLVAFLAYMEMAAEPMGRAAEVLPRLQRAGVSATRLWTLLTATENPARERPDAVDLENVRGVVRVVHLNFRYPKAAGPALHDIDFTAKCGEKIAIVGPNGSGKSTLLDLLLRLQTPDAGRIEIDGMDIQQVRMSSWNSVVGIVPQDILVMNKSIAENIALGLENQNDVECAGRRALLDHLTNRLPQGYGTLLGPGGVLLSGGERQRIAIARLFLRDPKVILMDEPTSALDMQGEMELLPILDQLCANRTTFVVSHRGSVLRGVDKVLLLENGRQIVFDSPAKVWREFPQFRNLFLQEWKDEPGKQN